MSVFVLFHPCSFSTPWHDAHITHIHIHGSCLAFTCFIFFFVMLITLHDEEIMMFLLSYVKSWTEQRARVLYGQCSSNGIHQKNTRSISKTVFLALVSLKHNCHPIHSLSFSFFYYSQTNPSTVIANVNNNASCIPHRLQRGSNLVRCRC